MKKAKIYYFTLTDEMRKEEKLDWFSSHSIEQIEFEHIQPDKNSNWINLSEDNDWESLLPVCSRDVKQGKNKESVFQFFSTGYLSGRDDWIIACSEDSLKEKVIFYLDKFNNTDKSDDYDTIIKWSRNIKRKLEKGEAENFDSFKIRKTLYRPFVELLMYDSDLLVDEKGIGKIIKKNDMLLCISGLSISKPFQCIITKNFPSYDTLEKTQCLPLCRYEKDGSRIDNITDWALEQFRSHYQSSDSDGKKRKRSGKSVKQKEPDAIITKEDIFHYTYAVLHNPAYRKKYELNLKREFPRLPFYPDFWKWAEWGNSLMDLHIHYERVKPFPLKQIDREISHDRNLRVKLKADKAAGVIELDEQTGLQGIPAAAWEYRLGNRSALEWILDQYREKKPKDPTIAEKFSTYRFSDYKAQVIDLLRRICTVSIETMKIIDEMR